MLMTSDRERRCRTVLSIAFLAILLCACGRDAEGEPAGKTPAAGESAAARKEVLGLLKRSTRDNKSFAEAKKRIAALGAPAEKPLISRLAAKDPKERANAVTFLAAIASKKSIPYFLAKKRDKSHEVRIAALEALQSFKDPELIDKIAEAYLADEHPSVRDMAVIVLGSFKHEKAVPHLVKALDDTDEYARECARKGLESFSGVKTDEKKPEAEQNKAWKAWFAEWKKSKEETEKKEKGKEEIRKTESKSPSGNVNEEHRETLRKGRKR